MFEELFNVVMTEYGVFVSFLLLTIAALSYTIRVLWKKLSHLQDKLLETVVNNTKVITQLVDKLEHHDNEH